MKRKFTIIIIKILFLLYNTSNADFIVVDQSTKTLKKWNIEVIYEIKTSKNLYILLDYYDPITYSNFYNSQEVKENNFIIKGDYQINNITNENYKLIRILTTMAKNSLFINKSYTINSLLNLNNFTFSEDNVDLRQFQSNLKKIKFLNKNQIDFINNNIITENSFINRIIETLIFLKRTTPIDSYSFKSTKGSLALFLNSLVEGYRIQGIQSRIVHGYSIPAKYRIRYNGKEVVIIYPRGAYHWIEIFIPNIGWLPIDPFLNILFFIPNNIIRKSHGNYFSDNLDMNFIYPKKDGVFYEKETIFSEDEYSEEIINGQNIEDKPYFIISAPIQIKKSSKTKKNINSKKFFMPEELGLFENNLKVDMEITKNQYYSQELFFETKTKISKVVLPLYFLELTKSGKVWVEVVNKGKTYRTNIMQTPYKDLKNEYFEYTFTFNNPIELEGNVSVILRISDISAVFWYAIIGDIIGTKDDTISSDGRVIYIDFCLKME